MFDDLCGMYRMQFTYNCKLFHLEVNIYAGNV